MADQALQKESLRKLITSFSGPLKEYRSDVAAGKMQGMEDEWKATLESIGLDFDPDNRLVAIATLLTVISSGDSGLDPSEVAISHLMTLLNSFIRQSDS